MADNIVAYAVNEPTFNDPLPVRVIIVFVAVAVTVDSVTAFVPITDNVPANEVNGGPVNAAFVVSNVTVNVAAGPVNC